MLLLYKLYHVIVIQITMLLLYKLYHVIVIQIVPCYCYINCTMLFLRKMNFNLSQSFCLSVNQSLSPALARACIRK